VSDTAHSILIIRRFTINTETTDQLLKLWKVDDIPLEQVMGHVLQHLVRLDKENEVNKINLANLLKAVDEINRTLVTLKRQVDALITHTHMPPTLK